MGSHFKFRSEHFIIPVSCIDNTYHQVKELRSIERASKTTLFVKSLSSDKCCLKFSYCEIFSLIFLFLFFAIFCNFLRRFNFFIWWFNFFLWFFFFRSLYMFFIFKVRVWLSRWESTYLSSINLYVFEELPGAIKITLRVCFTGCLHQLKVAKNPFVVCLEAYLGLIKIFLIFKNSLRLEI